VNAQKLYQDLKARGVILEAQGEHLKVDAHAGVVTKADRAALVECKPKLLKFLSRAHEERQQGPERVSMARWAGSVLARIRDPFTGKWHEWLAVKCLPGVMARPIGGG
jgi:hypothetical protein